MKINFLISLVLFFSLMAQARTFEVTENGPDVLIPIGIWKKFGDIGGKDSVAFAPIVVRLAEKTPGVLVDPDIEIKLPRGGGQVDLSQFVTGKQGTFHVFFQFEEMKDSANSSVYFISRARKRDLDNEIWGAGCNKYMDIKNDFLKRGQQQGIEVNTTRNRHLSVLGGTFFFSHGPQISQVTFTDSQQSQFFCESK